MTSVLSGLLIPDPGSHGLLGASDKQDKLVIPPDVGASQSCLDPVTQKVRAIGATDPIMRALANDVITLSLNQSGIQLAQSQVTGLTGALAGKQATLVVPADVGASNSCLDPGTSAVRAIGAQDPVTRSLAGGVITLGLNQGAIVLGQGQISGLSTALAGKQATLAIPADSGPSNSCLDPTTQAVRGIGATDPIQRNLSNGVITLSLNQGAIQLADTQVTGLASALNAAVFRASNGTSRASVTGDGTSYVVPWDVVTFNDGGFTIDGSGNVTVPKTGAYVVSAMVRGQAGAAFSAVATVGCIVRASSGQAAQGTTYAPSGATLGAVNCSDVFKLTAGASLRVEFVVSSSGGLKNVTMPSSSLTQTFSVAFVGR